MKSTCIFEAIYNKSAKKTPSPEKLKTIGKTCIPASAKKNYHLNTLRLRENPYKTLGNRWFPATAAGTGNDPHVCTKEITLGAPCENVGFPWFSWRSPLPHHCGFRWDLGGGCKILRLAANRYKTNRKSIIPRQWKMQGTRIGIALNVGQGDS